MKIVLSPAKTLDYTSELPTTRATQPKFLERTKAINAVLKSKSKKEISDLMNISDKLAELNYERYQEFELPFTKENARPAVYAFNGDVYSGLDAYTIDQSHLDTMQNALRILSGYYGLLRPLDLMQPYRLEMGTKLAVNGHKDLYDFWQSDLTAQLNKELEKDELFINLASKEYSKAIDAKALKTEMISPVFKDYKNGKLKIISFYAKKARGAMARFAIENKVEQQEELLSFSWEGYGFSSEYTLKATEPVFIR